MSRNLRLNFLNRIGSGRQSYKTNLIFLSKVFKALTPVFLKKKKKQFFVRKGNLLISVIQ